jgi:hypothetical protein
VEVAKWYYTAVSSIRKYTGRCIRACASAFSLLWIAKVLKKKKKKLVKDIQLKSGAKCGLT